MYSTELQRIKSTLQGLQHSIPGTVPDKRVDVLVKSVEAIAKWIEKFEDQADAASKSQNIR